MAVWELQQLVQTTACCWGLHRFTLDTNSVAPSFKHTSVHVNVLTLYFRSNSTVRQLLWDRRRSESNEMHLLQLNFKYLSFTERQVNYTRHRARETKRKCESLTYLLSFFSGGDFLSQPWKTISPPLMFVSVCSFLSLYRCRLATSTWRLLNARCSKCCRCSALAGAVCSPHLVKIRAVLTGDVVSRRNPVMAQGATARKTSVGEKKSALLGNYAEPAEEEPRGH